MDFCIARDKRARSCRSSSNYRNLREGRSTLIQLLPETRDQGMWLLVVIVGRLVLIALLLGLDIGFALP